jgi:glycosyltransferase involved in cell wall biosynthesis
MKKLFFWCDTVTPHWLHTLSWLSLELNGEVHVYADSMEQLGERRVLGWGDFGEFKGVFIHDKKTISSGGIDDFVQGYNLILNPFNNKFHKKLVAEFASSGIRYGLQQSMPGLIATRLGRVLRRMGYGLIFGRLLDKAGYVLCHGEMCRDYLVNAGADSGKLFPSGYFVPRYEGLPERLPRKAGDNVRAIYLGQFIERKAILPLAKAAIKKLKGRNVVLDFAGTGSQKEQLLDLYQNGPGVVLPPVVYSEVIPFLRQYDVLVLPSRADEWAVVVNEAIHAGCAVIVTDKCGAADLVNHGQCGVVVSGFSGCIDSLIDLIEKPQLLTRYQAAAERLSPLITPEAGARYLARIIVGAQAGRVDSDLKAPWLARQLEPGFTVV